MIALQALLVKEQTEKQRRRTWETYVADMVWCCAARYQKKFPVRRYSEIVSERNQSDKRSGRAILNDLKDKLRKRKGVIT